MLISGSIGESLATAVQTHEMIIEIGGMAVCVRTESAEFRAMLEERYAGFVPAGRGRDALRSLPQQAKTGPAGGPGAGETPAVHAGAPAPRDPFQLDVELLPEGAIGADEDVRVLREGGRWVMTRGDFRAEWEPEMRRGVVRQTANPYAIDSVLRILHTLLLAEEGGFLLHAASAIRNGKALVFAGRSGAGKTTLSRLAPGDVTLLSDEISYIRRETAQHKGHEGRHEGHNGYLAYGTPFAGELAKAGENVSAPVAGLYFLEKSGANRMVSMGGAEAFERLMQNILFFAEDERLVRQVFAAAADFLSRVPAYRLEFAPEARVWGLIG